MVRVVRVGATPFNARCIFHVDSLREEIMKMVPVTIEDKLYHVYECGIAFPQFNEYCDCEEGSCQICGDLDGF